MDNHTDQLHAIVQGSVQGVYFRDTTRTQAQRLALTGWVRNGADGSVEVLAQGPRPALEQLLEFLRRGPPAARVTGVETEWAAAKPALSKFEIKW